MTPRLLILSSEFPPGPGGIGTHAYQAAVNLGRKGWQVTVVSRQDYASDAEVRAFNERQPFETMRLRSVPGAPLEALSRWRVLSRRIRSFHPHALLASGARQVWLAACLARRHALPWLAVGHGGEFAARSAWTRRATRWSFERAAAVVCVSRYTWSRMLSYGIEPRRGEVIPNGADASRFAPLPVPEVAALRERLALGQARVLLSVGNVTPRKGHDVVIRALPAILRRLPDVCYLVAGLPTRSAELTELARGLGVAGHVRFLGRVAEEELVQLLNACDLFVMTSRHAPDGGFEGYGIAVVEAALCGKPAVVSANSGLLEAISHGETGFAVPEEDPSATAEAIVSLLTNEPRRRRMGEAARRRAVAEQTWEVRMREYDRLLRSIAPGSEPRLVRQERGGLRE